MSKTYGRFNRESGRRAANARWRNHVPDRDESADDRHYRMLEDRRGFVVRAGCDYSAAGVRPWCVRYAVRGRVDQFEGVYAGQVIKRAGPRNLAATLKKRLR